MKLLLEISYLGTGYHGYQVQKNAVTVEGRLQSALEKFYKCPLMLVGCSRTDAGVHAESFFLTVEGDLYENMSPKKLPFAITQFLPEDISVNRAWRVEDGFHARYDVMYKEYKYLIWNEPIMSPFFCKRAWHCPLRLDIELMNECAASFVGAHDFSAFMAQGGSAKNTVRDIKYLEVEREGSLVTIKVASNGFLYNMVRIIAGTLVDVGMKRIPLGDIENIIASRDRKRAGPTLPPDGLYLSRVVYKNDKFFKN